MGRRAAGQGKHRDCLARGGTVLNAYADSSFLFSLYIQDVNSPVALTRMAATPSPLLLTEFGRFELLNALRAACVRGTADPTQVAASLRKFRRHLTTGVYAPTSCDWPAAFAAASRLSARFTTAGGHRALDVLHVAVARQLGAVKFLSFDTRQRALAARVGLNVQP